jgi:hypothetical protein
VIQRYDKVIDDLRHQPTRRKLCKGGYVEMLRPPELFATSAIILLCFAFLTRFINPRCGRFRFLAWQWLRVPTRFGLHRTGDRALFYCQRLLTLDVAM